MLLICSLGRGYSSGFHLAFPTIIALAAHVSEPMGEFCQLLNMSIPLMHVVTGEVTTGGVCGPLDPL